MNIQSGKMRNPRRTRKNAGSSLGAKLVFAFRITMILAVAGGLANAYIYLNQKISETEREILQTKKMIHDTEREIDNLRIKREALSAWPHIRDSINRFDLKLKAPDPRQVRKLAIIPPAMAGKVAAAIENRQAANAARFSQR